MYITANVPITEIGSARLGITVAETLRKKTKMTATTRTSVRTSVNFTSCTDSRIVTERSYQLVDLDAGRQLRLAACRPARSRHRRRRRCSSPADAARRG